MNKCWITTSTWRVQHPILCCATTTSIFTNYHIPILLPAHNNDLYTTSAATTNW